MSGSRSEKNEAPAGAYLDRCETGPDRTVCGFGRASVLLQLSRDKRLDRGWGRFSVTLRAMSIPIIILLIVIGAVVALLSVAVVVAYVRSRRIAKLPPPPPCKCPACDSEQIDVLLSGLWDGHDSKSRGTGGTSQIGTCKSCGVHCEHISVWDIDTQKTRYESRVLTDEEWQRETASTMKIHRDAADWPFASGGESHVA